jgi:hypothetical protein
VRAAAIAVVVALICTAPAGAAPAASAGGTDALGAEDPRVVARAVAAITERVPADPDLLFAAARACEDRLDDPARAALIYERITTAYPDARVAIAAARRLAELRPLVGARGETSALAADLAQLIARADSLAPDAVFARATRLAAAAWPGAPNAALWLADWLRRAGRIVEAQAHYAIVAARWPGSPQAREALRGAVASAIDARNWSLAERLASRLPAIEPADRGVRDNLRAAAALGRRRAGWYVLAWLVIAGAGAALLGSLAEATRGSPPGARRSALRPPIEVVFLAPIVAVLIGVAFTTHRLIAPAVAMISIGGLVLAYLSGATLEHLRQHRRATRLRGVIHAVLCLVSVVALVYIALTKDHLLDLLIETVRFGPET